VVRFTTGADSARLGVFRAAHGGTLLLDEIGDLDRELQPKLLRVLQQRRLVPVGEDCEHSVDVRVIAATNRPLEQMVASGEFRADLYERLNVLCIRIPPLRERPEDVEVQARHFLALYQSGKSQSLRDFSPKAMEALRLFTWGGNTRQLQNLLRETLARKPEGPLIELEDLPRWVSSRCAGCHLNRRWRTRLNLHETHRRSRSRKSPPQRRTFWTCWPTKRIGMDYRSAAQLSNSNGISCIWRWNGTTATGHKRLSDLV
jgi:transcriptional regulator with PAS, ATPase and Fis domain